MNIFRNLPFYAPEGVDAGGEPKPDAAAIAAAAAAADKGGDKGGDKSGSFLAGADDTNADDKTKIVAPADWPDDWRDKMAGDDKELRKRLDRAKAPTDIFKSYIELEKKFKSGKTAAGDEPMPDVEKDPEGAKAWRETRGIPPDPTGYAVPDTVKGLITDADKPKLAEFTQAMHDKGIPAAAVGPVMEWYFQQEDARRAAESDSDKIHSEELQDELRSEWGSDFRANSQIAKRFAETITPGVNWFDARLPDGRMLGNIPDFVKALSNLGTKEYGDVAFAGGEREAKTLAREDELRTMMRDDPDKYFGDKKYSAELTQINEAKLKKAGSRSAQ